MMKSELKERVAIPGVYKEKRSLCVTTWFVKIKDCADKYSLSDSTINTIEYTMKDYLLKRYGKFRIIGVFPSSDRKGFYVLTRFIDSVIIYDSIIDYLMDLLISHTIPDEGKILYESHDLAEAKRVLIEYYEYYLKFKHSASKY